MSENNGPSNFHLSSRKRKRNFVQPDMINLTTVPNQSDRLSVHSLDPTPPLDYSEPLKGRSLPRKRRLPQQLYYCPQQTQPLSDIWNQSLPTNVAQTGPLTPQICFSTVPKHPSISPKTALASSNSRQQTPCTPASFLRPCHICYRKPTTREFIQAYTDCSICGQRSCYICLRQCEAGGCTGLDHLFRETHLLRGSSIMVHEDSKPCSSQPRKICSRCAVENVTETGAEVVKCLDCVRGYLFH